MRSSANSRLSLVLPKGHKNETDLAEKLEGKGPIANASGMGAHRMTTVMTRPW
jgi:hypothetical protein